MKPLALLFTDLHIEHDNHDVVRSILLQLLNVAKELNIKKVIGEGDFFTERKGQDLYSLLLLLWFVGECKKVGIELHLLPGNHDKINQSIDESYLDVCIGQGAIIHREIGSIIEKGVAHFFLPYYEVNTYYERLKELNQQIRKYKDFQGIKRYLHTHFGINGAKNNDHMTTESVVKVSDFSLYDKVFTGHYHNQSKLGKNIYYIGAAYPHDFGEDNMKGFTILMDNGEHQLVKAEFPKYIKKVFDPIKLEEVQEKYNIYKNYKKGFVRFVFRGTEEELSNIDSSKFETVGIEVKKESYETAFHVNIAEHQEFVDFNKSSIKKMFVQFCAVSKISMDRFSLGKRYLE